MATKIYTGPKQIGYTVNYGPNVGIGRVEDLAPGSDGALVQKIQDPTVYADIPWLSDKRASYFIDRKGTSFAKKTVRYSKSNSGAIGIDKEESRFISGVFKEIDSLTGLTAVQVRQPNEADFIVGKFPDSAYGSDNYAFNDHQELWFKDLGKGITDREKWLIASRITFCLALWYVDDPIYTTTDTIMVTDQYKGFYGFSASDYSALVLTLGPA